MRRIVRFSFLALGASALALASLAPGAGAGIREAAPLEIVKTVTAPFPAGTTFTATLTCVADELETDAGGIIQNGGEGTNEATVTFGADGQPTSASTFFFNGPGQCTVTETANGGAISTTYACEGSYPDEGDEVPAPIDGVNAFQELPDPELAPVCPSAGPQAAPITVNIESPSQTATVTITNTPGAPQPAAGVIARPAFTG